MMRTPFELPLDPVQLRFNLMKIGVICISYRFSRTVAQSAHLISELLYHLTKQRQLPGNPHSHPAEFLLAGRLLCGQFGLPSLEVPAPR